MTTTKYTNFTPFVDFLDMHPEILKEFAEPMKVISDMAQIIEENAGVVARLVNHVTDLEASNRELVEALGELDDSLTMETIDNMPSGLVDRVAALLNANTTKEPIEREEENE